MEINIMKTKNIIATLALSFLILLTSCAASDAGVSPTPAATQNNITTAEPAAVEPTSTPIPSASAAPEASTLTVHYIDVGQADSSLIICGGESMLIDGGNVADSDLVAAYLKKENISTLDYLVCTHAHEDHCGGLAGALSTVKVENALAPQTEADTQAYQNFKDKAAAQGLTIIRPNAGDCFTLGGAYVRIVGPITEDADDLNNTSIVMKLEFGNTSFLFAGDAERDEEQEILNAGYDISADVLKVGHHGSDSSTSYVWLREIMPKYAVISVGKGNSYGHPAEDVLSRLRDAGTQVFRTDLQGDIIAQSDGNSVTITTEKNENIQTNETEAEPAESGYIGNRNSKKFHRPNCRTLPDEKNRVPLSSREEAVSKGYSPCGNCNP